MIETICMLLTTSDHLNGTGGRIQARMEPGEPKGGRSQIKVNESKILIMQ